MTFIRACAAAEVRDVGAVYAQVDGIAVSIVRDEHGDLHAIDDMCSHGRVSLSEGEVEGCTIECWMHGSRFDLVSGRPLTPPATDPIAVFPVRIEGEDVLVAVDSPCNDQ